MRSATGITFVTLIADARFPSILASAGAEDWFAQSGIDEIREIIARREDIATRGSFPVVGDRVYIREFIERAREELARRNPGIEFNRWVGDTSETIHVVGFPAAVWVRLVFDAGPRPKCEPRGVIDGDQVRLTIELRFSLSSTVKRGAADAQRWWTVQGMPEVDVPGIGEFKRTGKWFERLDPWTGSIGGTPGFLVDMQQCMIDYVRSRLADSDSDSTEPDQLGA